MQDSQLGCLAERGDRRDPKPLVGIREGNRAREVELGGIAQARYFECFAIGWGDGEFTRDELRHSSRRSVSHDHAAGAVFELCQACD